MSTIRVREYLHNINREDLEILEFPVSSATVELAAKAVGVEPEMCIRDRYRAA